MTVSVTYLSDLNRVRISYSSAPAGTDYAFVERSLDGVRWETIRGGEQVVASASAGSVDDYEFTPGVSNQYRVSYVDADLLPSIIGPGTAQTGNNTSLVPPHPASLAVGDWKLIAASIRNSGVGTVNAPAGWTKLVEAGNVCVLARVHQAGDTAPTVTFSGGVANADTIAQMVAVRNSQTRLSSAAALQLNGVSQNIAGINATRDGGALAIQIGWKQDDFTSSSSPLVALKIADVSSTLGDDAGMAWYAYGFPASNEGLPFNPWPLTITGGAAAISRAVTFQIPVIEYLSRETGSITPSFTQVWIKNLQRPYMNTALSTPVGELSIKQAARAGVFAIKGRSLPVAVTDLRGGREFTIGAQVLDAAERDRLTQVLKAGEPILLHIPPGPIRLESMYAVIGDIEYDDEASIMWMPLTEVAAPAASIVGSTVLWQDIVTTYATWSDLIAAKATWADVLASVGDPTDIITG
ncbi:MAG TPA: hypothetical protein VG497_01940 [Kribbella sp.]|nr:hypothetical protein [Kribbella sp.]